MLLPQSIAPDCEFACPNCLHNPQSLLIKDQLIQFLFNETLQTDIFAKATHLISYVEIIKYCEAFENAQYNHNHLQQLLAVQAFQSSIYQQQKNNSPSSLNKFPISCSRYGSTTHGQIRIEERPTKSPMWGKVSPIYPETFWCQPTSMGYQIPVRLINNTLISVT